MEKLNLEFAKARPIVTVQWTDLQIALVGCGGTGSHLAPHLARIAAVLREGGKRVKLTFIDPDRVEAENIPRQNFCYAELGRNKAQALALRYGAAWGLDIEATPAPYKDHHTPLPLWRGGGTLQMLLIVGAVDNAAARLAIAETVGAHNKGSGSQGSLPHTWWLDCGNMRENGQVLLGCACAGDELRSGFRQGTICTALPAPSLLAPDLLQPLPEEIDEGRERMSCAQLAMANAQGMNINAAIAAIAADYVLQLVGTGGLRRFATYLDLAAGVAKSFYTTPEEVASVLSVDPAIFEHQTQAQRAAMAAAGG